MTAVRLVVAPDARRCKVCCVAPPRGEERMPADGTSVIQPVQPLDSLGAHPVDFGCDRPSLGPIRPMAAGQAGRRPDSAASALAVLAHARDLLIDQQRWCQGAFARSWFNVPVPPQSALARRFCAIGAIMRAGRELQLRTQDACVALEWQTAR